MLKLLIIFKEGAVAGAEVAVAIAVNATFYLAFNSLTLMFLRRFN